jgi:hypothetical protein
MPRIAPSIIAYLLLPLSAVCAQAQDANVWPSLTQTAKPWTRWWWPGSAVNESDLTRQLESFASAGLGGVEITPIYGVRGAEEHDIAFLSSEWMRVLEHASGEAKRLDLGFDMATGTGWPFGGPRVVAADAIQKMVLNGGRLIGEPTGMRVKRAAPGGDGLVLDPYSTAALSRYLEPFSRAFAHFPRDHIRAQFHDSFEYYDASWTTQLPTLFREQHGYDIQTYAAELLGERPMGKDQLARIKSDYRHTLARMHRDYLSTWVRWSHEHGFVARNQSHGAPANLLDLYGLVDIPETESFGSTAFSIAGLRRDPMDVRTDRTPPHPLTHRMASSAANVMGRKLTSSETGTWLREHWRESPAAMKPQVDQLFVTGVNHILYHGTPYTPSSQAWPGWYFYASTQLSVTNPLWNDFAAFNTYVTRVQSVLQTGSPDNEVLLYWPFADVLDDAEGLMHQYQVEKAAWLLDSPFAKTALELEAEGYAFDFISDDQLLETKAERGLLHTPGNQYKAIIVPATRRMPLGTLTHLRTLAEQGAIVVFESLPEDVPGYSDLENRRTQIKALLNAEAFKNSVAGEKLGHALAEHGLARERMAEAGLHYVRRAHPSGHDYFIVNLGAKSVEGWIELGRRAHQAVLLDPLTGRAGVAAIKDIGEKKTSVFLQLASGESLLLRARDERGVFSGVDTWAYVRPAGEPSKVEGEWTLSFLQGGPKLPAAIQTSELKSWTQLGDQETQRFGGTARYRIEFETPQASADEWILDLGDVREAARVRLNGKEIASALSLPFRVRLGPLAQRQNVLEIDVANFAANRIRDMDRRGVKWKLMKEIDIVNIQYQPFDASQWDIAPSGLLGPVTLIPMKRLRP